MPNWCRNTVRMEGIEKILRKDENGNLTFSFNDFIPMPASLKVDSGSSNDYDIMTYLTEKLTVHYNDISDENKAILKSLVMNSFDSDWIETVWQRCLEHKDENMDKSYEMGKILVENVKNYGCPTWYEWAITNWGTKWDVCSEIELDDNSISFDTAWAPPVPVLAELSKRNPNKEVTCDWHEEGGLEGMLAFLNGECTMDEEREWSWEDEDYEDE